MIKEKVVFILGAGASEPYGFPLGPRLVRDICTNLNGKTIGTREIAKALSGGHANELELGWMEDTIVEFRNKLIGSKKRTIDSFLSNYRSFVSIGKLAIAQTLIPFEKIDALNNFNNNWYKDLYALMDAPFEKFDKNECRFITFNYDRSLDYFLFDAIRNSYEGQHEHECIKKISKFLPVHLYGQLNYLISFQNTQAVRTYGDRCTPFLFREMAKSIKIIYDDFDIQKSPEFQNAQRLIDNAEKIIFLGFGYDQTNLERLNITSMKGKDIIATRYNLDRRVFDATKNYFKEKSMDNITWVNQHAETLIKEINLN